MGVQLRAVLSVMDGEQASPQAFEQRTEPSVPAALRRRYSARRGR